MPGIFRQSPVIGLVLFALFLGDVTPVRAGQLPAFDRVYLADNDEQDDEDEGEGGREYRSHRREHEREAYRDQGDSAAQGGYIGGGSCNRSAIGAVVGGVVGGVVGSQVGKGRGRDAATVVGVIVGAMVGNSIGRSMDRIDRLCTGQTLEYAADRQPVAWHNPDSGGDFVVTPLNSYQRDGRNCRDYTTQATFDGRIRRYSETSCRQADNSWRIVNR